MSLVGYELHRRRRHASLIGAIGGIRMLYVHSALMISKVSEAFREAQQNLFSISHAGSLRRIGTVRVVQIVCTGAFAWRGPRAEQYVFRFAPTTDIALNRVGMSVRCPHSELMRCSKTVPFIRSPSRRPDGKDSGWSRPSALAAFSVLRRDRTLVE